MFCSSLQNFYGYLISKKQNLIVKIFQIYSFEILYFNIEKGRKLYYLYLLVESIVKIDRPYGRVI